MWTLAVLVNRSADERQGERRKLATKCAQLDLTYAMWIVSVIFIGLVNLSAGGFQTFRGLFIRMQDTHLSTLPQQLYKNSTVEHCARSCVRETKFECQSFDFDNVDRSCRLHNFTHEDVVIVQSQYIDHYRSAYEKLFHRIPNHVLTLKHNLKIPGVSVEKCARRCVLEVVFKCRGFDYEAKTETCWLTDDTPQTVGGIQVFTDADYYERIPEGPLAEFVNYGSGTLRPIEGVQIYNKIMLGVSLEACAQLCIVERAFDCLTIDYIFGDHSCHLSEYIAANVHGMTTEYDANFRVMHYERKEQYLKYFYSTPYAVVLGNNDKTFVRVTPDRCARNCLEEETFICRSFDYQIKYGTCLLSSRTGSDIGGLYNQGFAQIHHFEMKPVLDCGGFIDGERGNFASPNWPRHYAPHSNCKWVITVPKYKVVHFHFSHFDLGPVSGNPCDDDNDRLEFEEHIEDKSSSFCAHPHSKKIISKTNSVTVRFTTNYREDSMGFRVFFKADWPCAATLKEDNGEFASPHWPNNYDALSECTWTIRAPLGSIILLRFTMVQLESHGFGSCNDNFDRIKVYDGPNTASRVMETFCGQHPPISLRSSGQEFYIKFKSDERVQQPGFHATYKFIPLSTPTILASGRKEISTKVPNSSDEAKPNTPLWVVTLDNEMQTTMAPSTSRGSYDFFSEGKEHAKLTADFGEPLRNDSKLLNKDTAENNKTNSVSRINSHSSISVSSHDRLFMKTLWAVAASLMMVLLIVVITLVLVCRYYRRRIPKRRNAPNFPFVPEENVSLYEKENNINCQSDETDTCRISSSVATPTRDVAFSNPLYDRPKSQCTHDEIAETTTCAEIEGKNIEDEETLSKC